MCAIGVFVAVVFALIPVGVYFGDDPLLRLRQLDPQLSPPEARADCGSPVRNLSVEPAGTSLYDVARASDCENAARRRLLVAVAAGAAIVMTGLIGLASDRRLGQSVRYSRPEGSVGERIKHGQTG